MRFFDEDPFSVVQPEKMVRAIVSRERGGSEDLGLEALALVTFTYYDLNQWVEGISEAKPLPCWKKRGYSVYRMEGYVIALSSMGAPGAVMLLEELAAFGVKRAIYLGYCGALRHEVKVGDLVIPTEAIREEGTSYHYVPVGQRCFPDLRLQDVLSGLAQETGLRIRRGVVWTTDAPYRETRSKVLRYGEAGVLGVEMEMSALFAVGMVRRVSVGALLLVSDELGSGDWRTGFFSTDLEESRAKIVSALRPRFRELWPGNVSNRGG